MRGSVRAFHAAFIAASLALGSPAIAFAGPSAAAAGEESHHTIAVPPIRTDGDMSAAAVKKVEEELRLGLERAGLGIVTPDQVKEKFDALPCENAGCIVKLARATAATHVLEVSLALSGRDYTLDMVLRSGADGSTLSKSRQDCEICGLKELGELIGNQAAALKPKLGTIPATLIVETNPPGAMVKVDGKLVGITPVVEPVAPGRHKVVVSKQGFLDKEREVTFVEAGEESMNFSLQSVPIADTTQTDVQQERYLGIPIGWSVFGVGVGLVGAGIPLFVIHERPQKASCENLMANETCRFRYNTIIPAAVLVSIGGAAIVAGAVVAGLAMSKKKKAKAKDKRAAVVPFGLGIAGRF